VNLPRWWWLPVNITGCHTTARTVVDVPVGVWNADASLPPPLPHHVLTAVVVLVVGYSR